MRKRRMTNFNLDSILTEFEKKAGVQETAPSEKPSLSDELQGLLSKEASDKGVDTIRESGRAAAKAIMADLEKIAEANKIEQDNTTMEAQDANKVEATPEGTVDDVLTSLVDRALASGAQPEDQVKQAEENTEMKLTDAQLSEIAEKFFEKLAFVGDQNTQLGVEAAPAPNKIQVDNAALVQTQEAEAQDNPQGTVNQIVDALMNKAIQMGGQPHDAVAAGGANRAAGEGVDPAAQAAAEEVEKAAAVSALCEAGLDFEAAVDMVKAAAFEIAAEEFEQVKVAAANELIGMGIDLESAVSLVKVAGSYEDLGNIVGTVQGFFK